MKKKNLRTRVIAIAMAAISMFSASSMLSVSAAETVPQTSTAIVTQANLSETGDARMELRDYLYNEIDHSKVNLIKRFENQQNIRLYNHENGTLIVAHPKQNTLDKSNESFSAINQIKSVTYPGSLIKINEQFVNGTPTKINADRNKMKFSVDCGRKKCSFYAVPQTEGDVLEEVYNIIDNYGDHDVAAQATLSYAKASSASQLQAELGVSAAILKGLGIDFKAINEGKQSTYVMKYRQIYYTVSAELPQNADEVFADTVTKDVLAKNKVNSENIPAYISSVSYGREVYVVVTSNTSKTSINASEKLAASKFSFNSKQSWESALENCSVNVYMLGGASSNITDMLKVKDFDSFIDVIGKETKFTSATCAYPLSYTANYITTNERVATKVTGDYTELEYTTTTSIPVDIEMVDLKWPIGSASITITGDYISGVDADGNFTHNGVYEKIYETTQAQSVTKASIPANVDLKTVKIKFDYTGISANNFKNDTYSLSHYDGDINNLKLQIEGTNQCFFYKVEARVWVNRTSDFTDKNCDFYSKDNGTKK
jgi:thiol-activated cytolysin